MCVMFFSVVEGCSVIQICGLGIASTYVVIGL